MSGWIKDFRKEIDSDVWLMPPMYHRVWQWIKYSVNHTEAKIPNRDGTFTTIKAGQRATSYRQIAKCVGYYEGVKWKEPNVKTVKSILDWMVKQNMITVDGNTRGTILTVANWELYQSEKIEGNTKRITESTPSKHSMDTNKNDKEELKNDKEDNNTNSSVEPTNESEPIIGLKFTDKESQEYKATLYFIERLPDKAKPPKEGTKQFDTWVGHIEKIHRLDKFKFTEIRTIIDYATHDGGFWQSNILSTKKLREKAVTLLSQSKNWKGAKNNNGQGVTQQEYDYGSNGTGFDTLEV